MIKQIITDKATVTGREVRLIDVQNGSDLINLGEVRISDPRGELEGLYAVNDEIEVKAGFELSDGTEATDTIFTGYIQEVDGETLKVIRLKGKGDDLRRGNYRKSFNQTDSKRILTRILEDAGVNYELGSIPAIKRHSYICPNGTHFEELIRAIDSFNLELAPYFDRDGVLILKSKDESVIETDIVFEDGEFDSFNDNMLTAFLDIEIAVFSKIKILDNDYIVYNNRMYIDDNKTKSILTVGEV